MTPYSDRPTWGACRKCDNWLEGWNVAYHETAHDDYFGMGSSYPPTRSEHLCWSCPRCGYAIQTEPADAKSEAPV